MASVDPIASLAEYYISNALHLGDFHEGIIIAHMCLCFLIGAVLLTMLWNPLRGERWIGYIASVYLCSAMGNGLWLLSAPEWSVDLAEPLSCLFLIASARELGLRGRSFPWWALIAAAAAAIGLVLAHTIEWGSPLHTAPLALFSIGSYAAICRALATNIRKVGLAHFLKRLLYGELYRPFLDNVRVLGLVHLLTRLLCYSLALAFAITFVVSALHPWLANWHFGFKPMDMFPKAYVHLPVIRPMDGTTLLTLFGLRIGLFMVILYQVARSMSVISPHATILQDTTDSSVPYLDPECRGGLLAALGHSASVDYVSLIMRIPGNTSQVSWWGWFEPTFLQELKSTIAFENLAEESKDLPEGYRLHQKIVSPMVLESPNSETTVTGKIFQTGKKLVCQDLKKPNSIVYQTLVPGLRSFVAVPIIYHGGVIGVLSLESRESNILTAPLVRNVQQMARYLAPTFHSRRELNALSTLSTRLSRHNNLSESQNLCLDIVPFLKQVTREVHEVLRPLATCMVFRQGFTRILLGIKPNPKNGQPAVVTTEFTDRGEAALEEFLGDLNGMDDQELQFHEAYLGQSQSVNSPAFGLGMLVLVTRIVDTREQPALARDRLLRKSGASLLYNAITDGVEKRLNMCLRDMQVALDKMDVSTPEEWFSTVSEGLRSLDLMWVRARLLRKDQAAFLGGEAVQELKLKHLATQDEHASSMGTVSSFPSNNVIGDVACLLRISLPEADAELWLGLTVEGFSQELDRMDSPWVVFLENLGTTIGLSLARIELLQLEKVTTKLEFQAQRSILQSLWLHELGNKAGDMASGALRALELMAQSNMEDAIFKVERLKKIASDFSKITLKLNRPVKVEDDRRQFPLIEAVELVCEYANIILESRGIKIDIRIPRNLQVAISFQIAYLALSNLVTNAIRAIKSGSGGILLIEAEIDQEKDRVLCHVKDTGEGVAEMIQNKIFRPGFTTGADKHSGTGLPGSREALRKNNGDLWYDPKYKSGACFTMAIPRPDTNK